MSRAETLSALDAFFLYLESPATPMHTASVAIFEGAPLRDRRGVLALAALQDEIVARLHLVPKLRRRVLFPAGQAAGPVWVDDPDFDITFHVRHLALPAPGTEAELTELCAELMAVPLDRAHPLWEMWFVEGLSGGRVALVQKLHHALADGLAGVELATVLLDLERHVPHDHAARPWHPHRGPAPVVAVAKDLGRRGMTVLAAGRRAGGSVLRPVAAYRRTVDLVGAAATFASPRTIAPRSSLNVPVSQGRRLALVRQPVAPLRAVERAFGATLNDVVLAATASGLGELLAARGEPGVTTLTVLVPVGVDHGGDHHLGNAVSALFVPLPVGSHDPVAGLRSVSDAVRVRKVHHQALVGARLLDAVEALPPVALAALAPLVHRQRLCNLVVTNVPGPPFPLYAMGARLLEVFPLVPLAGNLSVGVAVFSYEGQLTLGITADRDRAPDVDVLAAGIGRGFAALVEAAGPPAAAGGGGIERPPSAPRAQPPSAPRAQPPSAPRAQPPARCAGPPPAPRAGLRPVAAGGDSS